MFSLTSSGSFDKTESFLKAMKKLDVSSIMKECGELGVTALSDATPIRTGLTATSWGYEISVKKGVYTIAWTNSDVHHNFPIAIMLQYGHATGTGGYVQGRDYINPAIRPIFDQIAIKVWKAVTSA
jgi:hypothetical protein